MVTGSLAGAVLTFYDLSVWVGLISCITSAVVAWTEFSGTEKKLDRYSNVVTSLKMANMWWDALPEVERLATTSIDTLVDTVEGQLRAERRGWRASSQSLRKMQQALNKVANAENQAIFESAGGGAEVDKKSKYITE